MAWRSDMSAVEPSGLEIMRAMVAGEFPRPPMADTSPMTFSEAQKGYIKFLAKADNRHLNIMGGVHGGFIATVLDSVAGCAVHTMLEAGVVYSTVDLNIKMLRPIPLNIELVAEGKVLHVSKRIGVAEGSIKNAEGTLLAHATATCVLIRKEAV
jgi:uncharacterized protein (TIGR00369 family)